MKYDINQAVEWYEQQKKGLSKKFMTAVKNCTKIIKKNPYAFAIIFKKIRKIRTEKFPYSLFYELENHKITIFAVIHSSRSEENWKERVK